MPPSDPHAELDALLAPISADSPSGRSIVYEEVYDRIKKARQEDDTSLPQGVWQAKAKTADWGTVAALASEAIENKSKDLKLAGWLSEAWVKLHGFAGVPAGVALVAGLCDRYWDSLYPELDEEGPAPRLSLLDWLDRTLESNVVLVPFVGKGDGSRQSYRLCDWHAATSARRGPGAAAPIVTAEGFLAAASLTGQDHWAAIHDQMTSGLSAIAALDAVVSQHFADPPATMHRTRRALETILGLAQQALSQDDATGPGHAAFAEDAAPAGAAPRAALAGSIASRAEAYALLTEASDYLLRTEPHSPVPYLVKRAVAWGNLPLAELLQELVAGQNDLDTIRKLLGMKK